MRNQAQAWEILQAVPRPVVAWATDYPRDTVIPPHSHPRAQLIYAFAGVMTVRTAVGTWVVPPARALWVPARIEHAIHAAGVLRMRSLYIAPDAAPRLPRDCRVIAVSPLLRALILRAMGLPRLYDEDGADGRIMILILDELQVLPELPLHLPMPVDRRLQGITHTILADASDGRTLEVWGRVVGASGRNLARLFRRETGMTFGLWRQQARLLAALVRLAEDVPVTTVALDVGYDSSSAFSHMFKRALGKSPSEYFK